MPGSRPRLEPRKLSAVLMSKVSRVTVVTLTLWVKLMYTELAPLSASVTGPATTVQVVFLHGSGQSDATKPLRTSPVTFKRKVLDLLRVKLFCYTNVILRYYRVRNILPTEGI